ncbi:hypothetical protein TanjilG_32832 [Lupinus angustifolius]|uniref:Uncharacterized protein n=1 Tax=Lupinus angustifolius TaxID=3871 RepID=A0A4P1RSB4_LUPAN|nr:hypothetical protein TanjilG_32832 [Lupinus angustifolius]
MPQLNQLKVGHISQNKDKKPTCIKRSQQLEQAINKFQVVFRYRYREELVKVEGSSALQLEESFAVSATVRGPMNTFKKKVRI